MPDRSTQAPTPPEIAQASTLPDIFNARVALTPGLVAYRQYDARSQTWVDWTWAAVAAEAARWRRALAGERFPAGSRIATIMVSSVAYVCVDQAALSLGLAIVPLHPTDNPGNVGFILRDSEISALVIDNPEYWAQIAPEVTALASLKRIVIVSGAPEAADPLVATDSRAVRADTWVDAAAPLAGSGAAVSPETMAAIVYTSGTTGRPKGVMLSHRNVVSNVLSVMERVRPATDDVFLSFLPLSHTFERTAGYYLPIAAGSTVAYARSIALLGEDMRTVRPTVLISVPRVYERAYASIQTALSKQGPLARRLFDLSQRMGWRRFLASQASAPIRSPFFLRLWPILDRLVAAKIRAQFGGRLRVAVSGGAPMPPAVSHCFLAMGIDVLQGYGMTETSPILSANSPTRNDPATVGEPIEGVEVKIGANDELMVRGPNVMMGYWRRPEETARVLEPDGWLHTGDQASLKDGVITIKGRIKDIIVTSTGEKISPSDLEQAITADPFFDQVMVIGEQRPFIAALAVLNRSGVEEAARDLGIEGELSEVLHSDQLRAHALAKIGRAVTQFPKYATPREVWLTIEPWTVGAALITPTLKLKRQAIESAFAKEIERLYAKRGEARTEKT
jgi:long-chain acyl-CoA synthetase